jgi:hypothetical protein
MTTIAFIENEQGFAPSHIKNIKKKDVYYLVIDGVRGQIHHARSDAIVDTSQEEGWRVEGVLYE